MPARRSTAEDRAAYEEYIRKTVDAAPPLTEAQIELLTRLFRESKPIERAR